MFKIWAKIVKDEKIIKQMTYERYDEFSYGHFFEYLADICEAMDICTPILIKPHIFNYAKFNQVRFLPRDFAESIDFDKLILENILS